jgi:hypothetical protein
MRRTLCRTLTGALLLALFLLPPAVRAAGVTVSALGSPFLTATATDVFSGTSEFSEVFLALNEKVFLPLVLRDHD